MKNKIKFISALFVILGIVSVFTSCPGDKPVVNYTITYISEHGVRPDPIKIISGTILSDAHLPTLQEEGYTFLGWFENGAKISAGSYSVNHDVTLTAKWEVKAPKEIKYTVTFKTDYGKVPEVLEVPEKTTLTKFDLEELFYDGYTFKGWYDESGKEVKVGEYIVTEDVVFTAKWEKNTAAEEEGKDQESTDQTDESEDTEDSDDEDETEDSDSTDNTGDSDDEEQEETEDVEKGSLNFTIEVKDFADFEIITKPENKDITLSVAKKYDSYSWTIKTRSSTSTKTKKTVTLTEADYKYGVDVILVVQDGEDFYSAQYFIKGE